MAIAHVQSQLGRAKQLMMLYKAEAADLASGEQAMHAARLRDFQEELLSLCEPVLVDAINSVTELDKEVKVVVGKAAEAKQALGTGATQKPAGTWAGGQGRR